MNTLIGITREDLKTLLIEAVATYAATQGTTPTTEQQVSKQEAMKLAGYKSDNHFRQFCKANGITPVEVRAKRHYYLPSHILNPPRLKPGRRK
jgi:hypothetical protein